MTSTCKRRDGLGTAVMEWVRTHPRLGSGPNERRMYITDLDYLGCQYAVELGGDYHVLMVEWKIHGNLPTPQQLEPLRVVEQAMWDMNGKPVKVLRGEMVLRFHGFHVVSLEEGDSPNTCARIVWDATVFGGEEISPDELANRLGFYA